MSGAKDEKTFDVFRHCLLAAAFASVCLCLPLPALPLPAFACLCLPLPASACLPGLRPLPLSANSSFLKVGQAHFFKYHTFFRFLLQNSTFSRLGKRIFSNRSYSIFGVLDSSRTRFPSGFTILPAKSSFWRLGGKRTFSNGRYSNGFFILGSWHPRFPWYFSSLSAKSNSLKVGQTLANHFFK